MEECVLVNFGIRYVQAPIIGVSEMTTYPSLKIETAPEKSRDAMRRLKENAGMIPDLAARMSTSPTLIEAFVTLREIWQAGTLDAQERETLGLVNAVVNGCDWCVAFHSFVALKVEVDREAVDRVRTGEEPVDTRLRALTRLTRRLTATRGRIDRSDLDAFLSAGFSKEQALEVVVGLAVSLLANYAGNFVEPQLDAPFQPQAWSRQAA